ncbi:MAG: BREX-1 system adenine-specific DNA-methyltransferase PglX [Peptococcaceae bacterium]|jgi:hypothetical protein|nr:BREX-1 system adenine-specific DNA-methyltransferase PglX [Peptococcaceae bacterium]
MERGPRLNKLRGAVVQCRNLLETAIGELLEGRFGVHASGEVEDASRMSHLSPEESSVREMVMDHLSHVAALGETPAGAVERLVREIAFTHLNRFCAFKMMEERGLIRETVSRVTKSNGFLFYLADHPAEEKTFNSGGQEETYRHFLMHQARALAPEAGALFSPDEAAQGLFPPRHVLQKVLELLNQEDLAGAWGEDDTIGWVYQYFIPKELRERARQESPAPRNGYELSFRNQFYTPRYVVEYLVDNTMGRLWYEMREGETALSGTCANLIPSQKPATRAKKDPRDLKVLDPACGSGHFLLYAYDVLEMIYAEAYDDPQAPPCAQTGRTLRQEFPDPAEFRRAVPGLILQNNLFGVDIDLRAVQITGLALWLRAQKSYRQLGLKAQDRPQTARARVVCAEPMPGERELLREFTGDLQSLLLGHLVEKAFLAMRDAAEIGSLLKVEEEIRKEVEKAGGGSRNRRHHEKSTFSMHKGELRTISQQGFDISVARDTFWEELEQAIASSLNRYSGTASNGHRFTRRLFARDAEQGFSFIDIFYHRFDVVLMNPPFGESNKLAKDYVHKNYPLSKQDLACAFVERGLELLNPEGFLGAITTRTPFFLSSSRNWRENVVMKKGHLFCLADLGHGVLESAMVEAAAYVVGKGTGRGEAVFFRLLKDGDKGRGILDCAEKVRAGEDTGDPRVFRVAPEAFRQVPGTPFAYWVSDAVRRKFTELPPFEGEGRTAKQGLATADDFRFVRAWWEVRPESVGRTREETLQGKGWVPFAKGGAYSPYYADVHLVMNWKGDGEEIKGFVDPSGRPYSRPQNTDLYFRPGLTWPLRTTSEFSIRVCQQGCVFGHKGPVCFAPNVLDGYGYLYSLLALMSSSVFHDMLGLQLAAADAAARSYEVGVIQRTPVPDFSNETKHRLADVGNACVNLKRNLDTTNETSHVFSLPSLLQVPGESLADRLANWQAIVGQATRDLAANQAQIDAIAAQAYGLSAADLRPDGDVSSMVSDSDQFESGTAGSHPDDGEDDEEFPTAGEQASPEAQARDLLSYLVGAAFGRWDVRLAKDPSLLPKLGDPFDPLPLASPGMLLSPGGLPPGDDRVVSEEWLRRRPDVNTLPDFQDSARATLRLADYPLAVPVDGVLVDDPDHPRDIVRMVYAVLEYLWGPAAERLGMEIRDLLGVKDLRQYFGDPRLFFETHLKRYSMSRRKAPIYWLLQSRKRSYAVWLYYPRLHKDSLFQVLQYYIAPKIRLVEAARDRLMREKEQAGDTGARARQLECLIESQESVLSELADFREKVDRVANFYLTPDSDDGVILNMAPLWEVVPWKEPKKYWQELSAGKYRWSAVASQLRERMKRNG